MRRTRTGPKARSWLLGLFALASPASAEHVLQSIPLNSPDTTFVVANSFVRDGDRLYLAGSFFGQIDFNPNGPESLRTSTCPASHSCSFVAAYDADMRIVWFDLFYGTGDALDHTLVARSGGGVYLLLDFSGDLAYVPNTKEPLFHAFGVSDIAAIALDADGTSAGATRIGTGGTNALRTAHAFEAAADTVDFAWMHLDTPALFGTDAFVTRVHIGTREASTPIALEATDDGNSIAAIRDQRIGATERYVCGTFRGVVDFDALHAHRVVETPTSNGFVARYDASGALVWLSTMTAESGSSCDGLAVSADGTLSATGGFGGIAFVQTDGEPVPGQLTSWGDSDPYLLAWDSLGTLRTNAHFGGPGSYTIPDRIEAFDDGTRAITGSFGGTLTHGFAGTLARSSNGGYNNAFVIIVGNDLTTRYFGQLGFDIGATFLTPLQAIAPMQIEAIAQMALPYGGNSSLNYALPPEHALLHSGTWASAYVRYDLDTVLDDGFEAAP